MYKIVSTKPLGKARNSTAREERRGHRQFVASSAESRGHSGGGGGGGGDDGVGRPCDRLHSGMRNAPPPLAVCSGPSTRAG
mmetsp:Transcript_25885/g.60530  ORF Transcript_25885/g.60530 Transcript_25885/m.60530 type:complete len:81 (+) Transcript_25885:273-515(+)